jgi:hypothetical protein
MTGTESLARFVEAGYTLALVDGEIAASGAEPPPDDLRKLVEGNRDGLKAAVLLSEPPSWLAKLFELYRSGHETPVRRTIPKRPPAQPRLDLFGEAEEEAPPPYPENLKGGKPTVCMVSVSIKSIAAAVAAEIGVSVLEWERIRPEVEEAVRPREGVNAV